MDARAAEGSPTNALIRRVYRHQALPVLFGATGQPTDKPTPRRAGQPNSPYVVAMRVALPAHSHASEAVDTSQPDAPAPDAPTPPGALAEVAPLPPPAATNVPAPLRWVRRALSRLAPPAAQRTAQAEAGAVVAADDLLQPGAVLPAQVQPGQTHTAARFDLPTGAPAAVSAPPIFPSQPAAAVRSVQPALAFAPPPAPLPAASPGRVVQAQVASPTAAGHP